MNQMFREALARCGVTESQYSIFERFADPVNGQIVPIAKPSEDEGVVATCIEAGWLRVLTSAECERARIRWPDEGDHCIYTYLYVPGKLELTEHGAETYFRTPNTTIDGTAV